MKNFDVFFDASLNKLLNKQFTCWWFETSYLCYEVIVMCEYFLQRWSPVAPFTNMD